MLNGLLLSIALSTKSLDSSADSAYADTIAYADLTGDRIEERIEFHRSYMDSMDSSFCKVFGYDINSKYEPILLLKVQLDAIFNYKLFVEDYNEDGINDFTIALPNSGVEAYITWDREKGEFVPVFEPLFEIPEVDSLEADSTEKED